MTTESKDRGRIRFDEVAKLAASPASLVDDECDEAENSGMINLAAVAAGRPPGPTAGPRSDGPRQENATETGGDPPPARRRDSLAHPSAQALAPAALVPPERGRRLMDPPEAAPSTPVPAAFTARKTAAPPPPPSFLLRAPMTIDAVSGLTSPFPSASALLQAPDRLPPLQPSVRPGTPTTASLETSRPTSFSMAGEAKRGVSVWLALGAGIALGGLLVGAYFGTHPSRSTQATPPRTVATAWVGTVGAALQTASPAGAASVGHETGDESWHPVPSSPSAAMAPTPRATPLGAQPARPMTAVAARPSAPPPSSAQAAPGASSADPPGAANPVATTTAKALGDVPGDPSLEEMMRKVVGSAPTFTPPPGGDPHRAPDSTAGLPAKPSLGAVQGAVGAVLPATRYCLGPDDPVAQATITFQSDGSVKAVAVSGDAAGQPAEACIRSRLMGARVAPFSSPAFTWTVTVRPAS